MPPDPDPDEVAADNKLVEDLRDGARPPTGDQLAAALAAMRDEARGDDSPIFRDLATERPITLPEIFGDDPALSMLPVRYAGHTDWPLSTRREFTQDDGSTYVRPDPDEFDSFDEVDSTTIVNDGAPD